MLPSKWENLSLCSTKLIHFCKNYHLHWIAGRANILCKYIIYIFFQFSACLLRFLFYVISKSFTFLWLKKKKKKIPLHCTSICMSSKVVSHIFQILFQTGDINIFVLRGVLFSRYVQLKYFFSDEKNFSGEIWDTI